VFQFCLVSLVLIILVLLYKKGMPAVFIPKSILIPLFILTGWIGITFFTHTNLMNYIINVLHGIIYMLFFILILNARDRKLNLSFLLAITFIQSIFIILRFNFPNSGLIGTLSNYMFFSPNFNLVSGFIAAVTITNTGYFIHEEKTAVFSNVNIRTSYIIIFIINTIAIFIAQSRAVVFIYAVILLYYFRKRFSFKVFIPAACFLLLIVFLNFNILTKSYDPLSFSRPQLWFSALRMCIDNPVFGIGLGNYGDFFPKYNFPIETTIARYGKYTDFAHNELLQIGAELGVIGVVLIIWLLFQIIREIKHNRYISLGIAVILFQSLFDFNLHLPVNVFLLIILISAAIKPENLYEFQMNPAVSRLITLCLWLAGIFSMVFIVSAYFQMNNNIRLASKINPINPDYYYRLSLNEKDIVSRIKLLERSIYLNPDNYTYHSELGLIYWQAAKNNRIYIKDAISELKKAEQYNPYNAVIKFYLGKLYFDIKEYRNAKEYFVKSVELEPLFVTAYKYLVYCSRNSGEIKEAGVWQQRLVDANSAIKNKLQENKCNITGYERMLIEF